MPLFVALTCCYLIVLRHCFRNGLASLRPFCCSYMVDQKAALLFSFSATVSGTLLPNFLLQKMAIHVSYKKVRRLTKVLRNCRNSIQQWNLAEGTNEVVRKGYPILPGYWLLTDGFIWPCLQVIEAYCVSRFSDCIECRVFSYGPVATTGFGRNMCSFVLRQLGSGNRWPTCHSAD